MLETLSSSYAPKERQEVNLDAFVRNLNITQNKITKLQLLEKQDRKLEEKEIVIYEEFFDGKIDFDNLTNQLNSKKQDTKQINQYEVNLNIQENSEKEKLLIYSKLADLSYIHLKTNPDKPGNESFEFQTVSLDPTSFEHIGTIFDNPNIASLTEDELFLYNYINQHKNIELDYQIASNSETENILKMAGLDKQLVASNIEHIGPFDSSKAFKRILLLMGLKKLVKNKEIEAKKNFENLKQDFEIKDYYPNETRGDKDSSGFGAVFLEKDGKKYIAIRGTEGLNDWKDLYADGKIAFWKAPGEQMKAMTDFIDRCITIPGEKFSIVGHSLGGALSQIGTSMYADQIEETYTFNSPGAKKLNLEDEDLAKFAKFRDFVHNRDSKEVGDLITNVEGAKGISIIADLGEDIGNSTIELKGLSSHSITEMIKYIDGLARDSEELRKLKIKNIEILY